MYNIKSRYLKDAVKFIDLRLAREEWFLHEELSEYAADRPHVYWRAVLLGTQQ